MENFVNAMFQLLTQPIRNTVDIVRVMILVLVSTAYDAQSSLTILTDRIGSVRPNTFHTIQVYSEIDILVVDLSYPRPDTLL